MLAPAAAPVLPRVAQMYPRLTPAQIERVASAVGEGSICVQLVHHALQES